MHLLMNVTLIYIHTIDAQHDVIHATYLLCSTEMIMITKYVH